MTSPLIPISRSISHSDLGPDHVKVHFELVQDDEGYPPAKIETLWAVSVGAETYRIDNIPFFVYGISSSDLVHAHPDRHGDLRYTGLRQSSGHSTIRVIFFKRANDSQKLAECVSTLRERMRLLGCPSEQSHIQGLVSIDIPPNVSLRSVTDSLDDGQKQGLWDYEEATIVHTA